MEWSSAEEKAACTKVFTARDALSILRNMSDEDVRVLGFNPLQSHPRNMILTTLLLPPPCVRPAVSVSEGSRTRGQDDLTTRYQDILKKCKELKRLLGGSPWQHVELTPTVLEACHRLQCDIFSLVNANAKGCKLSSSSRVQKSITCRIRGKDGRVRGNIMGKRVDFSARSVISPGPTLDIDQVGVPIKIACLQTVPETVNDYNLERLRRRVLVGANDINGAECVITNDGVCIQLSQCDARSKLCIARGWIVERYLENDDIVVFNRQPSLHKMGMMGHRVKLVDGLTFRMNLAVTAPYNADFDGDEMNLHVPQSAAARANVKMLMMVTSQILSPQANRPCMSLVQDALLGAYLMTRDCELLNYADMCFIINHRRHSSSDRLEEAAVHIRGRPYWTGKQAFSSSIPVAISMSRGSLPTDVRQPADVNGLLVVNGRLLIGWLRKAHLGTGSGGFIDTICREQSSRVAACFMSDVQRLTGAYNSLRNLNVGVKDCMLCNEGVRLVEERVRKATTLVNEISRAVSYDDVADDTAVMAEATSRKILSTALVQTGSLVETMMSESNAIKAMVMAGSKGSPINLSQIAGCVGQQSVEGKRVRTLSGDRTLPCYPLFENNVSSNGFVASSYCKGLDPEEFFFHSMAGREGLVDTSVKTACTGYNQRKLIKSMEDNSVRPDGSVRNAANDIVQFQYGASGMDPVRLERLTVDVLTMSVADVLAKYESDDAHAILSTRDEILWCSTNVGSECMLRSTLPFDVRRYMHKHLRSPSRGDDPRSVDAAIRRFSLTLNEWKPIERMYALSVCPKRTLRSYSANDIDAFVDDIVLTRAHAKVASGEMVGCIAAQSVGEPTTQMTLNTVIAQCSTCSEPFRRMHARTHSTTSQYERRMTDPRFALIAVPLCGSLCQKRDARHSSSSRAVHRIEKPKASESHTPFRRRVLPKRGVRQLRVQHAAAALPEQRGDVD